MSTGWVYVLSNPSIPNKVKVGTTKNRPEDRAKGLYKTGVPTPFKVETAMLFANKAEQIEHKTHDILSRAGVPRNKEFFECDARDAAEAILKAAEILDQAVATTEPVLISEEDILEARRKKERAKEIQAEREKAHKLEEERLEKLERERLRMLEEARLEKEKQLAPLKREYERQCGGIIGGEQPTFEEWNKPEAHARRANTKKAANEFKSAMSELEKSFRDRGFKNIEDWMPIDSLRLDNSLAYGMAQMRWEWLHQKRKKLTNRSTWKECAEANGVKFPWYYRWGPHGIIPEKKRAKY
ncbi:GIY-YIG nuclease family protein [bacterium]|nr:GIY-YIG nuclease family protein [Akkermansiaceae bacterium]MDB4761953.1 GIY-YIG nuclease family protein [bacterium]